MPEFMVGMDGVVGGALFSRSRNDQRAEHTHNSGPLSGLMVSFLGAHASFISFAAPYFSDLKECSQAP